MGEDLAGQTDRVLNKIKDLYPNAEINTEDIEKVSKAHADWVCKILNFVLTDFGVHMYKHGFEDGKRQNT